jgi:hypothetical protein
MSMTTKGKVQSSKRRRMICAVALVAGVATQAIAASPGVALADGARHNHHHRRSADVTFTKWVVEGPADPSTLAGVLMVGVVGGDVGDGRFAGEVLRDDTTSKPGFWLARVRYEFHGSEHSFVADVRVTEDDTKTPITATIRGVVARGWLKGAHVTGEYTQQISCPIPTPGNVFGTICWQGTLHLQLGHGED